MKIADLSAFLIISTLFLIFPGGAALADSTFSPSANNLITGELFEDSSHVITGFDGDLISGRSKHPPADLTSIEIVGPGEIYENSYASYMILAHFSSGGSMALPGLGEWYISSGHADLTGEEAGRIASIEINGDQPATLYVSYELSGNLNSASKNIIIRDTGSTAACADSPVRLAARDGHVLSCHETIQEAYTAASPYDAVIQANIRLSGIELSSWSAKEVVIQWYEDTDFSEPSAAVISGVEIRDGTLIFD